METTISSFEIHYDRVLVARTERMMDMSESVTYGMADKNGRIKIWNSWIGIVDKINFLFRDKKNTGNKSAITWNGKPMNRQELKKQFSRIFGRRSVE